MAYTKDGITRFNFAIPSAMHRGLKLRAVMNGESMRGLIIKAIEQTYPDIARAAKEARKAITAEKNDIK